MSAGALATAGAGGSAAPVAAFAVAVATERVPGRTGLALDGPAGAVGTSGASVAGAASG